MKCMKRDSMRTPSATPFHPTKQTIVTSSKARNPAKRNGWYITVLLFLLLLVGGGIILAQYTPDRPLPDSPQANTDPTAAKSLPPAAPQNFSPTVTPPVDLPPKPLPEQDPITAEIELYLDAPGKRSSLSGNDTGAKFEPTYGCYLGAYLMSAKHLDEKDGEGKLVPREQVFARRIGKSLASSFTYVGYGKKFPMEWAKALCEQGIAPHIAWEPNDGLAPVKDDAYLQQFASDAAACGGPIFLRFASEMNGTWTAYGKNPEEYRKKFRLVHDVMERLAPNVAMMWCVFTAPSANIPSYYPGDKYVDWVGVNIYNVYYHNNDRMQPAWQEHPTELLDIVYNRYASRKPIAIAEYGATHYDTLDNVERSEFAASKLAQLLTALPRKYPRVKLIDFFECNNVKYALPGRKLNNYAIADNACVLSALKASIHSDYFLPKVVTEKQTALPLPLTRITDGMELHGDVRLSTWVKTNEFHPTIIYTLDGKELGGCRAYGEYDTTLNTSRYRNGMHTLMVTVLDKSGNVIVDFRT